MLVILLKITESKLYFLYKRLVTEACYPYESAESGIATECKLNFHNTFFNNRMLCPSDGKPSKNVLISSSTPYQLNVDSAVIILTIL